MELETLLDQFLEASVQLAKAKLELIRTRNESHRDWIKNPSSVNHQQCYAAQAKVLEKEAQLDELTKQINYYQEASEL